MRPGDAAGCVVRGAWDLCPLVDLSPASRTTFLTMVSTSQKGLVRNTVVTQSPCLKKWQFKPVAAASA